MRVQQTEVIQMMPWCPTLQVQCQHCLDSKKNGMAYQGEILMTSHQCVQNKGKNKGKDIAFCILKKSEFISAYA
jgi:hypothetical protein